MDSGTVVADVYEIRRVLGAGGMGVVYEAHDRLLNRRVALKLSHSPTSPLRREAQALAAIRHPSMVGVYAMGTHLGAEFLVMELVRGTTLYDTMRKQEQSGRPFRVAEAVDILVGIAEGLAAIHASGISHRDVKPANIMLAPGNRTVLMDFGLFKPEFESLDAVAGSPEYMAPEVCTARVVTGAGHLVDLYALGIIAFELLTGAPPFRGATPMDTLTLHVHGTIPDVAALRPDAPVELAALVNELVARSPSDRPNSIDEVLARLRAVRARGERHGWRDGFSVLIVDDDRELAETLRAVVRGVAPDAKVSIAADGEAALASVKQSAPTVLLLDLNMPRMNGLELCMALRGSGVASSCRIVSITGHLRPKDRELLQKLGVADYVPKSPALARTLAEIIQDARRRPQPRAV
ncbi:MAG: protein kinase [Myxococcales bacterium]|nr:protein kinase [Myxococcales bacterium]